LILDGGLKTAIIKSETSLAREEESSIAVLMVIGVNWIDFSVACSAATNFALRPAIKHDTKICRLLRRYRAAFLPVRNSSHRETGKGIEVRPYCPG